MANLSKQKKGEKRKKQEKRTKEYRKRGEDGMRKVSSHGA